LGPALPQGSALAFSSGEKPSAAPKGDGLSGAIGGGPDLSVLGFGEPNRAIDRTRIVAVWSSGTGHAAEYTDNEK
jgi:hypothetical protein